MYEAPQTGLLCPGPVLKVANRAFSYRGAVMWNGLGNKLIDETNLNSFKSALTLSGTGAD